MFLRTDGGIGLSPEDLIMCVARLTGTEVKGQDGIDKDGLKEILQDDSRPIDCSQFNELLLMVHKDRVETPFFEYFFGPDCKIGTIPRGVERFQQAALLLYGNFVFGYRKLSRMKDVAEFKREVAAVFPDAKAEAAYFQNRQPKLLEIDRIEKDQTPFVGYLSANEVRADFRRCELLLAAAETVGAAGAWDELLTTVREMAQQEELALLEATINNFRATNPDADLARLAEFLKESFDQIEQLTKTVDSVRARATRNQGIYLTWDHMDVYFATSMRKAWEYKDLYEFIDRLMGANEIKDLGLRYFDPTQAYTDNRVNKGLVEALMLKRARCTVYSVQDTDTLGKDSELASTLAQGKPVIAFVPDLDVEQRTAVLMAEDPATILERWRFVVYADDQIAQRLKADDLSVINHVEDALKQFCRQKIWSSLRDEDAIRRFASTTGEALASFCRLIATAEKIVYDKRARTLKESHPLSLQVNLDIGVANGVLVVRTIPDCAALLRRILLGEMEFSLEENAGMWLLREKISGCIYRVVTNDRKLNNCFWNFYLR
jgi:hypothetical protein